MSKQAIDNRISLTDFVENIFSQNLFTMEEIILHRDYLSLPSAAHNGFTPLLSAIYNYQYRTVEMMLQLEEGVHSLNNVFSNESPFEGFTAFMLAMYCESGTIDMCKLLLKYANKELVYRKNLYGENLLFVCLKKCGRKEMEFWLNKSGCSFNLNDVNVNGQTLLHQSAGLGRLSIVDLLLSFDSDSKHNPVNISEGDHQNGDTALHYALQVHLRRFIPDLGDQSFSVLYRLVKLNGDLNVRSRDGTKCLEYCDTSIAPLYEILYAHRNEMPTYLDQLLNFPKQAIMNQFTFISQDDREKLWNALENIRLENNEVQASNGTCPIKQFSKAGNNSKSSDLKCPFKPNAQTMGEGGKCPVPYAESLYYNLPSMQVVKGFTIGLVIGLGSIVLFSMIRNKKSN